jgi:O-antigen ligase
MNAPSRGRGFYYVSALGAYAAFFFFYLKYVPLVRSFQVALVPVLLAAFVLTAVRREWGALFFVFCFPLINNLPYLFGIYEDTPHAPTALVLFLAFLLGWLGVGRRPGLRPALGYPLSRPLLLYLGIVAISGLITFLRFSNFFPFRTQGIYEFIVNVHGVRAGGALMSDVFSLLNYLTGPLFFVIILPLLAAPKFVTRILITFSSAAALALGFSLLQRYSSLSLGNTPLFIRFGQINGTFKDANSFAAFLTAFVPLAMGMALSFRGGVKWFSFSLVALSLLVFPAVGSRASLAAMFVALLGFALLGASGGGWPIKKKLTYVALSFFAVAALLGILLTLQSRSALVKRISPGLRLLSEDITADQFFNKRLRLWSAAWAMVKSYPLTGVGLGAYIIELPNYLQSLGTPLKRSDSALNYPIHVAAELGLVGLLLVVWLAAAILKQLGGSWRSRSPDRTLLLAGVLAGLAAFGVNIMFQTYVGSFEVKCTLWLFIALALSLGGQGTVPAPAEKLDRRFVYLGLALILVFGAAHFWNSTHSLSLASRTADLRISQDFGLDRIEKTADGREFRWSGRRAGLTVTVLGPTLRVTLLASHPDIGSRPVQVRVYLVEGFFRKERLLGDITIHEGRWQTYTFSLPGESGREIFLFFEVSRTWNPQKVLGVRDPRNLGVAIGKIES